MVLRYFGISVTGLERSEKFYTEHLGLRKVREGKMHHSARWVLLEDPRSHQRLELNWYPSDPPYSTPYVPGEGLDHINFKVQNAGKTFRKLVSKGAVPALTPDDMNEVKGVYYLRDHDGNWIEFF